MDIKLDSLLIAGLSMNDKEALLDYYLEMKTGTCPIRDLSLKSGMV